MNCCAKILLSSFALNYSRTNSYIYTYTYPGTRVLSLSRERSACLELSAQLKRLESVFFFFFVRNQNYELGRTTVSYCMQTLLHTIATLTRTGVHHHRLRCWRLHLTTRAMQSVCGGVFVPSFLAPIYYAQNFPSLSMQETCLFLMKRGREGHFFFVPFSS